MVKSDMDSITSIVGSATTSALSRGASSKQQGLVLDCDRALGAAASFGLSFAVLRLVAHAYQTMQSESTENSTLYGGGVSSRVLSIGLLGYFRRFLRRILIDDDTRHDSTLDNVSDGKMITHQGSCHCESVCFEAVAPRCLATQDGPGKIQFRRTEIKASKFKVVKGRECLNTYYVDRTEAGTAKRGAHAFCSRCGVHVLFAPDRSSKTLFLNVNCVAETGIRKLRSTPTRETISDGVAVEGQWDDQLSTISEVSTETAFMKRLYSQDSAFSSDSCSSGHWKTYPSSHESNEIFLQTPSLAPKGYPAAPPTPTTVDSFTATESQVSTSYRVPSTDLDSLAESDSLISLKAPPKPTLLRTPVPQTQGATTPQVRDQMKYFMRKHLGRPLAPPEKSSVAEEEKKSSENSITEEEKDQVNRK